MDGLPLLRQEAGGIVLSVRLTPRASRQAVAGIARLSDGRSVAAVRVRALPEDGAANRALTELLAKTLGVPKSAVVVISGHTSRLKQVRIAGDPALLAETIEKWPVVT